jgi:primary-amine oxidase
VPSTHPLDPLDAGELTRAIAALRRSPQHLVASVRLEEPGKAALAARDECGDTAARPPREARVVLLDRATAGVSETVVRLGPTAADDAVVAHREVEGAKAPILGVETHAALAAAKADPRIVAALRDRGIHDPDTVRMEAWAIGAAIAAHLDDGRRLIWTPMWHQPTPDANFYAHPIAGLHAIVDLATMAVVEVEDVRPVVEIPDTPGPYRASQTGAQLALRPLEIHQPDGPSFTVDGWRIDWERWSFRIGFCQREGLVIHDVRFRDTTTATTAPAGTPGPAAPSRKIAHRLSIAELVIPYGDPTQGAYRKNAFDTGEFGLGNYVNSLTLGCDCLGEIVYLDVALAAPDGSVRTVPRAICLHEEDHGILWKHQDVDGHVEVRRGRRFVASSIFTINNYEYGYFWYFHQDGSIEFEAKLTGIVLTLADAPGAAHPSATELAPGLWAPYHQHIFCARLDLDVDGEANTVVEVDAVADPLGPRNPLGTAFDTRETPMRRESEARRVVDPLASRTWKVVHPTRTGPTGEPVGYRLVPGHTTYPLASPDSVIGRRAGFMFHHVWVTPYRDDERYPAGDYPYQHAGGAGLPEWTAADRALEDTDVVLWHVFGTCHVPRAEDWPVMPVERTGFVLKPSGFFARSPGMDVAPSAARHCH